MLYHKFGFIHEGSIENIIVSSDGQWLLTIGSDRRLKQWGIGENRRIRIQTQMDPLSGRSLINEKDNKSMRGLNETTNSKLNDLDLFCDYGEIDQNWVWTAKLSMTNN